jgi:TonB-dependent receptor
MKTQLVKLCCLLFFFIILSSNSLIAQEKGTVRGTISDKNTGETLIGVNILVEGTTTGTITDFEGNFNLPDVPAGTVNLVFSYISYAKQTITDVEVKPGEVTLLNVQLAPATEEIAEVTVTAQQLDNTENAILSMQRKADKIQDGISSMEMKRYGASSAAESLVKVTGVSVVGGKNVVVRGLGDRYVNVQLNGQDLPSTDPAKNSADIDLIPANLLDNIITSKTFTPDLPGDFSGGSTNLTTKSFPEQFTLSFSVGTSFNSQSSLNDNFYTHEGGNSDWLGYDDGTRNIPSAYSPGLFRDSILTGWTIDATRHPYTTPGTDGELVSENNRNYVGYYEPTGEILGVKIAEASESFGGIQMMPSTTTSPLNQKIGFSIGNQTQLFGRQLGFIFGVNYKRNFSFYENGRNSYFGISQDADKNYLLKEEYTFSDTKGTENPQVSGLASIAYKISRNTQMDFSFNYSHDAEKESRKQTGQRENQLGTADLLNTHTLSFKERELQVSRLTLTQNLPSLNNTLIEASGSIIKASEMIPNLRQSAYIYSENFDQYSIQENSITSPSYFWRNLDDNQKQAQVNVTIPFLQEKSASNKIKLGGLYSKKDRVYTEDFFSLVFPSQKPAGYTHFGDTDNLEDFYSQSNFGILGINENRLGNTKYYEFGNLIKYQSRPDGSNNNDYSGFEKISALYAMVTFNLTEKLKITAGARFEITEMESIADEYNVRLGDTTSIGPVKEWQEIDGQFQQVVVKTREEALADYLNELNSELIGRISEKDILPAINATYELTDGMNIRASYSKTIARPNMREMSPYVSASFIGGPTLIGNPGLLKSDITNLDFRYEWYFSPGELFALSAYYKKFEDPIVEYFIPVSADVELSYGNAGDGKVRGIEVEFRKNLDFIQPLKNFSIGTNFSYTKSEMGLVIDSVGNVLGEDKELFLDNPDNTKPERPFYGQSPYLINLNLNYSSEFFNGSLSYNQFGPRLQRAGGGKSPDIFEESEGTLNFNSQFKFNRFSVSLNVDNILNSPVKWTQSLGDNKVNAVQYDVGTTFGITLSYNIN